MEDIAPPSFCGEGSGAVDDVVDSFKKLACLGEGSLAS